jgi:hypothetical protein
VSGYITFVCFLLCPVLYLFIHPAKFEPSDYIVQSYWHAFSVVNTTLLGLGVPQTQAQMDENVRRVFMSDKGLIVMRFIAFAYTYHYLNWFSKTAIIKWHKVPVRRLSLIGVLWAACIVLYIYNYSEAVKVLFCLSFLHVFLEFPLNHMSIIGVGRELTPATPAITTPMPGKGWYGPRSGARPRLRGAGRPRSVSGRGRSAAG